VIFLKQDKAISMIDPKLSGCVVEVGVVNGTGDIIAEMLQIPECLK